MEDDQMQDHKHEVSDPGHHHSYDDKYTDWIGNGYWGPDGGDYQGDAYMMSHIQSTTGSITGITVQGISSSYRHGSETRPKNMNVIYIMRVW